MNHSNSLAHLGSGPLPGATALQRAADEAARTGQFISPAPQSQVETVLARVDAGMEDLQNAIKRITGRLEPVLSGPFVTAEGGAQQAEPACSVPLVCRLNALATQLRKDCAALQDLERRLAL